MGEKRIGRLHVLTDVVLQSRFSHLELTRLALAGGADVIQLRDKRAGTRGLIEEARAMKRLCARAGAQLIVNDRVDVAIACEADGVHLGQSDFPILLARKLLGESKVIGGSASTLEEAAKCRSEGADYVGFGPVYPTASKADAAPASGLSLLRQASEAAGLPIIAIGGVQAGNAALVMEAGAHGIAVISAVCCQDDPEEATRELLRAMARRSRG